MAQNGAEAVVTPETLKRYVAEGKVYLTNMTLTSDGKLVDSFRNTKKKDSSIDKSTQNTGKKGEEKMNKSEAVEFFESLESGMPFRFAVKDIERPDEIHWKQALYIGFADGLHKFIDESTYCSLSAFSNNFLQKQNMLLLDKDNNDPMTVQSLMLRVQSMANK